MMRNWRSSIASRLIFTAAGLALGSIGLGWHGRPANIVLVSAIRANSAEYALASIVITGVARNWVREVFGTTSQFLVTAIIARPEEPPVTRCFGVEPSLPGRPIAYGPYADWRCRYPF